MPGYRSAVAKMKSVCNLVRARDSKAKLLERCFDSVVGRAFQPALRRFQGAVDTNRWGSVAFSLPLLKDIEVPLRHGWSLERYMGGSTEIDNGSDDGCDDLKGKTKSEICDFAIKDPTWWGYLTMLEHLASLLRSCHHWAEWCGCHEKAVLASKDLPGELRHDLMKVWAKCPRRGCRGADLAAGEFLELVHKMGGVLAAQLVMSLPADITEQQRRVLVTEFESGRGHLSFYFTLKLSHWTEPPWVL
jgi:hypothetical protein